MMRGKCRQIFDICSLQEDHNSINQHRNDVMFNNKIEGECKRISDERNKRTIEIPGCNYRTQ